MADNTISRLSTQPIFVPIRIEHPITGAEDLNTATVSVAIVVDEPKTSDFNAATVDRAGQWEGPDGKDYFLIGFTIPGESLTQGTHEVWIKAEHNGLEYIVRAGPVVIY